MAATLKERPRRTTPCKRPKLPVRRPVAARERMEAQDLRSPAEGPRSVAARLVEERAGARANPRHDRRLLVEESAPLSLEQRRRVLKRIEDEVMGLGPLEPLLADPTVADILVNGPQQVYSSGAASSS